MYTYYTCDARHTVGI